MRASGPTCSTDVAGRGKGGPDVLVYGLLVVGVHLADKRELAQLNAFDLVGRSEADTRRRSYPPFTVDRGEVELGPKASGARWWTSSRAAAPPG